MEFQNAVSLKISGKMALFTDPLTKMGGEKCSYPVPTYQAIKGMLESCYWKPTFIWVIDRVRVMKRIQTRSQSVRPIIYGGGNTLAMYTYLQDVEYHVQAHFIWNEQRPELKQDRNENKHFFIAKRMIEKGGRRDVFLGTRECQAYVEPCDFNENTGYYDESGEIAFGMMVHGINYPDETGKNTMQVRLWRPVMKNGVIDFIRSEQCKIIRELRPAEMCGFLPEQNFSPCDALYIDEGGRT